MTTENPHGFISLLNQGQVQLGEIRMPIESTKAQFVGLLQHRLAGNHREWIADGSVWSRYTLTTSVLWYPKQQVFFTFRDEGLIVVEFFNNIDATETWAYEVAVKKYLEFKQELTSKLGKASTSSESDELNMMAVWNCPQLSMYVACDAKTGGCAIGLRPLSKAPQ